MYDRKTIDKEEIVKVIADNYRLSISTRKDEVATMCSVTLFELVGLRLCMSCGGSEVQVYNPETLRSEYRFDSSTGEEIK